MIRTHNVNTAKIRNLKVISRETGGLLTYQCGASSVFGMGERYDSIDRMNKVTKNRVFEKFTHQGENTYFPLPFYFTNDGHGVFVKTDCEVIFTLSPEEFRIEILENDCDVYFLYGSPREIVTAFVTLAGDAFLPPEWAFGPWISANRWNKQSDVDEQLALLNRYQYPATVLVLEAWSDEATFYIWNGAAYQEKPGKASFKKTDFHFSGPWPDPQKMIDQLHQRGIKLLLWQVPALKVLDNGQNCLQHENDLAYALENNLVAVNADRKKTPYQIPHQWFVGSYLPDFTNPAIAAWWMEKRQYLLDMGIDGFKTDGGEFVHDFSIQFSNGQTGKSMQNRYCVDYEKAYHQTSGNERVLFSRAGYTGAQCVSLHWAGDQSSDFKELRSILNAGLSLGLSGIPFWGFDIGGFSGPMPTAELYLRATALAVFSPIMQWHSEPAGGQYGGADKISAVNDRSPWNIAAYNGDNSVCEIAVFFANLRMNLLPELYNQAFLAQKSRLPMMRHLIFDYPDDPGSVGCHDEFLMGDLLIAPVLEEGAAGRNIYFPDDDWFDLWSGEKYSGKSAACFKSSLNRIPVFLRKGGAVVFNLAPDGKLGSYVGNTVGSYKNLCILTGGKSANYSFHDRSCLLYTSDAADE